MAKPRAIIMVVLRSMRIDVECIGGIYRTVRYTGTHRKSLVERLEEQGQRRCGTQTLPFLNNKFVARWRARLLTLMIKIFIYAWLFITYNFDNGAATSTTAHYSVVSTTETGIKVGLNIFSTLPLNVSSFAMQGMTAQTRQDVDKAHFRGEYLETRTQS